MEALKVGLKGGQEITVTREHCTSRGGGPWIFKTPAMVQFCESSCYQLIQSVLGDTKNSVGTIVYIKHLAPTPEGMKVRSEVELIEVDRRRLKFKVKIFDEIELVGECEHERFVIDLDKAGDRIQKKIAMMKK